VIKHEHGGNGWEELGWQQTEGAAKQDEHVVLQMKTRVTLVKVQPTNLSLKARQAANLRVTL
jgi:hypothetical protein